MMDYITTTEISRESVFKTNNIPTNVPIGNDIYGKKVEELYNDRIIKTEDGTYWFFTETGNIINLSDKLNEQANPLYGKEIAQDLGNGYVLTSENKIYDVNKEAPEYVMDYVDLEQSEIVDSKLCFSYTKFYVVLDKYGKVWTCGTGLDGQLGNGSTKDIKTPVCISDIEGTDLYNEYQNNPNFKIEKIYCDSANSPRGYGLMALDSNGKLWSWGYNFAGELGNNTTKGTSLPICISNIAGTELATAHQTDANMKIVKVFSYGKYKYALDYKGRVWRWGDNSDGIMFTGDKVALRTPSMIQGPEGINTVEISYYYFPADFEPGILYIDNSSSEKAYGIIIDSNGKIWTAGDASLTSSGTPVLGKGVTSGLSVFESLGDIPGTELYNEYRTDANFKIVDYDRYPASYSGYAYRNNVKDKIQIVDNYNRVWMIDSTKYFRCYDNYFSLNMDEICTKLGIQKKTVIGSTNHSFVILDTNGKIWSFGKNYSNGYLGIGTTEDVNVPICISDIAGTELNNKYINDPNFKIEEIYNGMYALDSDGKIWTWGSNDYGQLGREPTDENRFVPTCISDISGTELYSKHLLNANFKIIQLEIGQYNVIAFDNDGKIWTWGSNVYGLLGDNTTSVTTNPNYASDAQYIRKEPKCICDVSGTNIYNAFSNNNDFKIVKICEANYSIDNRYGSAKMFAIDNTGKLWGWGQVIKDTSSTSYPDSYTGVSNTPIEITNLSGTEIKTAFANNSSLKIVDVNHDLALDNAGDVWILFSQKQSYDDITYTKAIFVDAEVDFKVTELLPPQGTSSSTTSYRVKDNYDRTWHRGNKSSKEFYKDSTGSGSGSGSSSGSETPELLDEEGIKTIFRDSFNIELEQVLIVSNTTSRRTYYAIDEDGKVWVFDSTNIPIPQCITDNQDLPLYTKLSNNPNFKMVELYTSSKSKALFLALDNEGKIWEFPTTPEATLVVTCISDTETSLSNAYSKAGFKINKVFIGAKIEILLDSNGEVWTRGYGGSSNSYYRLGYTGGTFDSGQIATHFVRISNLTSIVDVIELKDVEESASPWDETTVIDSRGKKWSWGHERAPHFAGYGDFDALVESTKTGVTIAEVLDETHIKDENGTIYVLNYYGNPIIVSVTYEPIQYTYEPVTLEGVNVVKNTNYKALDDEGNLYVWSKYTGGYKDFMPTSKEAISTTEREYIVEPETYQGNGWSEVKANY